MFGTSILGRGLFLALLALVWGSPLAGPARADALSDGRFRAEVTAILRAVRPDILVVADPDTAQIRAGGRTIALTNLYPRVAGLIGPTRRQEIETFLVRLMPDAAADSCCLAQDYAAARPRLRVQLVPIDVVQQHPQIAHRPFSDTLFVVCVLDEPHRYRYVTRDLLASWGVDMAQAEAVGVRNLAAASKDAVFNLGLGDGQPIFAVTAAGDDYDAARLLLPRYLESIREALKADSITVAVPTRDALMAWPAGSPARRDLAATVTDQMRAGPYGRSDELFRFERGELRSLTAAERADHGR